MVGARTPVAQFSDGLGFHRTNARDDPTEVEETELSAEERRLANFLDFIYEGRGSQALGQALAETERKVEALREDVDGLRASREKVFSRSSGRVDQRPSFEAAGGARGSHRTLGAAAP